MSQKFVHFPALAVLLYLAAVTNSFLHNKDCGSTLGCFHNCKTNGHGCTFLVSWLSRKDEKIEFTIKAKAEKLDFEWFAIGFSHDHHMGDDSVTACVIEKTDRLSVGVYHSFNVDTDYLDKDLPNIPDTGDTDSNCKEQSMGTGNMSCVTDDPSDLNLNARRKKDSNRLPGELATKGLVHKKSLHENGTFICHFLQDKSSSSSQIFDLTKEWILMFSRGKMDRSNPVRKAKHTADRPPITEVPVNFQEQVDIRMSPREQEGGHIKVPEECGITMGCFHDGIKGRGCSFLVTWKNLNNSVGFHFHVLSPGTTPRWMGLGFSDNQKMESDSVIECVMERGNHINIYNSYNEDGHADNRRLSSQYEKVGLKLHDADHVDGILTCSFQREKNPQNAGKEIFNLQKDWYLMFATGDMHGAKKMMHSMDPEPWVSPHAVNIQSYQNVVAFVKEKSYTMRKIHGILMVLAWITCASIGLVIARYYKHLLPNRKVLGKMVWFQIHRSLMVGASVLTLVSFIIIFVEEKKWVEIHGNAFIKSHPICGILVLLLAITNPILAIYRYNPDDRRRKYFELSHFGIGISAHILAVITIMMGVSLEESNASGGAIYFVSIYAIYQIGFELFMEFRYKIFPEKEKEEEKKEENNVAETNEIIQSESRVEKITRISLYVHLGAVGFLTSIIILLVALPS